MQSAPFFDTLAHGPDGGVAHWLDTADGVRIRAGAWPMERAKGTVLIFCGRTEYVEKYGPLAKVLQDHGYASLAIDWRGQGLSDRLIANRALGHVGAFDDYQHDVAAVVDYATASNLPQPFFLLGHSMGGGIGLRALIDGLPVRAAAFSAPMWGIKMHLPLRMFAWAMSSVCITLGLDQKIATGQSETGYVLREDFAVNTLTRDSASWDMLRRQLQTQPDLALGGPTMRWINQTLRATRALSKLPSPDVPCLTFVGTDESIVDPARIHDRMARWPNSSLQIIQDGLHEMLMDVPARRDPLIDTMVAHFDAHLT